MTTERDTLMDDIAEHLRPYARFRSWVVAERPHDRRPLDEEQVEAWWYEHLDYLDMALDAMIAAIAEAASYAIAWANDEPFPDCKHEHYDPYGRRMYGNCQDDEWGMTYGGNND